MICNYLNNIYMDYIHNALLEEEFIYSHQIRERILDLWNSVTDVRRYVDTPNLIFYFNKNNHLLFIKDNYRDNILLSCNKSLVWDIFDVDYFIIRRIIKVIIQPHFTNGNTNLMCRYTNNTEIFNIRNWQSNEINLDY